MEDKSVTSIVTVVIRTFNRANLVKRAIESVLAQTFQDFELIVLDDCSQDNTRGVVQSYMAKDPRIRYIRHEQNMGTGKGFNTANAAARGKYVAYLDDDDTWRVDKLEKQVEKFESCPEKVGFLTGGVQYWNSDTGEKLRTWIPWRKGYVYWDSLGYSGDIFGPPSVVMIRKSVLEHIGLFREDMPRGCCQQYFRRIAKNYEIDFVNDICLDYYFHKTAITAIKGRKDILNCIITYKIKIESTQEDLEKVPEIHSKELIKLGHYHSLYGQMDEGQACFRKAIGINGLSIQLAILLLGSKMRNVKIYKIAHNLSAKAQSLSRFWTKRSTK